jgi:hypothetical protein
VLKEIEMKTYEADDYSGIAARLREIQAEKASTPEPVFLLYMDDDNDKEWMTLRPMANISTEYFAQNLYMPWTTVEFDKAEDEGDRWISYSEKNRFPEYTDEELEEYVRNIPGSFWPLALDAYQDVDTNDKEGSIEWM